MRYHSDCIYKSKKDMKRFIANMSRLLSFTVEQVGKNDGVIKIFEFLVFEIL